MVFRQLDAWDLRKALSRDKTMGDADFLKGAFKGRHLLEDGGLHWNLFADLYGSFFAPCLVVQKGRAPKLVNGLFVISDVVPEPAHLIGK